MTTAIPIQLSEYLNASYRPDREYVDGKSRERPPRGWAHSRTQALLCGRLGAREGEWNCVGACTVRVAVSPTRVRLADLVLVRPGREADILIEPPMLVITLLAANETYFEIEERAADFRRMGVESIWIIDPETRTGRMSDGSSWIETTHLEVPGTPIYLDLAEVFPYLTKPSE